MTTAQPPRPAVNPVAMALARVSVLALPSGGVRDRYRLEHRAELCALAGSAQLTYALGALTSAWALRRAVTQEDNMTNTVAAPRKPLLCRLNIHHVYRRRRNPEGGSYRQCVRCGKDHPSIGPGPNDYLGLGP